MRLGLFLAAWMLSAGAVATSITYQGQLQQAGGNFTGTVPMFFQLHSSEDGNNPMGPSISETVDVASGLFQVELEFGDQPYQDGLWLQVTVNGFELSPRQRLTAAPLAVRALDSGASVWSSSDSNIFYNSGAVSVGAMGGFERTFSVRPLGAEDPMAVFNQAGLAVAHFGNNQAISIGGGSASLAPNNGLRVTGGGLFLSTVDMRGNVGINAEPTLSNRLNIEAGNNQRAILAINNGSNFATIRAEANGSASWGIYAVGSESSRNYFQRPVGIGVFNPLRDLHIVQRNENDTEAGIRLQRASGNHWGFFNASTNDLWLMHNNTLRGFFNSATGAYTQSSDKRLKSDIEPLDGVLDRLIELKPSSYRYADGERRTIGLIAQDVLPLFPELVSTPAEQHPYFGLSYGEVSVLNTQALIELNERYAGLLADQTARIAELERDLQEVRALAARAEAAENRLARLEAIILNSGPELATLGD